MFVSLVFSVPLISATKQDVLVYCYWWSDKVQAKWAYASSSTVTSGITRHITGGILLFKVTNLVYFIAMPLVSVFVYLWRKSVFPFVKGNCSSFGAFSPAECNWICETFIPSPSTWPLHNPSSLLSSHFTGANFSHALVSEIGNLLFKAHLCLFFDCFSSCCINSGLVHFGVVCVP